MSQEMKAFPGMKASQKLNFNHSEVIINSATDRKVILESTLLEQSIRGKRMWGNHSACLENNIERVSLKRARV